MNVILTDLVVATVLGAQFRFIPGTHPPIIDLKILGIISHASCKYNATRAPTLASGLLIMVQFSKLLHTRKYGSRDRSIDIASMGIPSSNGKRISVLRFQSKLKTRYRFVSIRLLSADWLHLGDTLERGEPYCAF